MKDTRPQPMWHQTLGLRLGAVLAAMLVAFDLLRRLVESGFGGTGQALPGILRSSLIAIVLAAPLAFVVSRWLTARLAHLSRSIVESVRSDDLSEPFDDAGNDEVSVLASTMNLLRARVQESTKSFALQDIRRREWIAQVSHDLRTPLTAQAACQDRADLILQKMDPSPQCAEVRRLLGVAKMDGARMHSFADDLLEIARLDAGDRLHLEPVPPGELASQAVLELEQLAAQRGIRLELHVTSHLPELNADGRRLMRAIVNLVRNAIQHARSAVEVLAVLSGDSVRFEVRDDGRGLPKQQDFLDYLRRRGSEVRLNELARRGNHADSAGLGLVVARRVAEAHRGEIDAYNLSQGGAAFRIDIPVTWAEAAGSELPVTSMDKSLT